MPAKDLSIGMFNFKGWAQTGAILVGLAFGITNVASADAVPAVLTEGDRADIARIETYLNNLTTMKSRFLQFSEQGIAEGHIFLDRPNRLRIEYSPPTPILLVASDIILMFHDTELNQTTFLPVSETPAGFFLEDKISLSRDLTITYFERSAMAFRVTLVQTDAPDTGLITLMFEDKPLRLAKWRVIDAQGARVEIALMEPRFGVTFKNPRELFSTVDPNIAISMD
ncbi:MAG: outer membrane lipoprotein carrier protein LolA [Alphaproteobacteria bacterium]|nr:outer membrane lipoprotein carrier protein LolA [Alphaproteobacteria bacterium]